MGFDDLTIDDVEEQLTNDDAGQDVHEWTDGDRCGEKGCPKEVHEVQHKRQPQLDSEPHESYNEFEYVCVHHGIVATR